MEQYIVKCLNSVISQPSVQKDSFEVIVVNDGSTDASQAILDSYDWKGVRHLLLRKENGGLSSARNLGFSYAQGDYVWFVDSDDWIDKDCLNRIYPFLTGIDAFHFPKYYRATDRDEFVTGCTSCGRTGPELIQGRYQYPVPFTIYKTNFLKQNKLTFKHGIVMEDLHFTPRAIYKASCLSIAVFPVYHYFQRDGSIMTEAVKPKRISDRIWIAYDLYKFMEENVKDTDKLKWVECITTDLNAVMFDAFRSKDREIIEMVHPFINKEKNLTSLLKFSFNKRIRLWYYLSKLCFGNYFWTYKLLYNIRYRKQK